MGFGKQPITVPDIVDVEELQNVLSTLIIALKQEFNYSSGLCRIECSETIAAGNAININGKKLRKADNTVAGKQCHGIALTGGASGTRVLCIITSGYSDKHTGLTADAAYYLSTAGALVTPAPGVGTVQYVGRALSSTELLINVQGM